MSVTFSSILSGGELFPQACLSHSAASYLGVNCFLRHICHIQQHLIWGWTVSSGISVTFSSILSGGSLFAQACLSHSAASYLGVHSLLRHVCHIQQHHIWGFTVCSGMSVTFSCILSGGSLFAQTCLSHSTASYLGIHCLLRHVCHIQHHLIWEFTVCSGMSVRIF